MISPLPVLAFVMLRNATQTLRDFHSRLFAWLGRFSLETFILQYHIWLAADTKALLSLGLWTRGGTMGVNLSDKVGVCCEFVLLTALFLWTSWAVSHATNVLTSFIVNGQLTTRDLGLLSWSRLRPACHVTAQDLVGSPDSSYATNKPEVFEQGHREKEDIKAPISSNQDDTKTIKTCTLALRMLVVLLLMWIGNWVSNYPHWYEIMLRN